MAHWSRAMPKKSNAERWREMAERTRARADGMRNHASKRTMLGIAMAPFLRKIEEVSEPFLDRIKKAKAAAQAIDREAEVQSKK
jgi:polysaccharide deacetylase 2 family uncharacterized protein YibQ